jgi:hypothetical protein
LENRLEARESAGTADGYPSRDTALNLVNRLNRFAVSERSPLAEGELRLATVRDPADRIASFWLDKLVAGPALWQARYYSEKWFPNDFRAPAAIESSFLAFLEALRADHVLLHSDQHWAPQSRMLRHWTAARCVMTEDLSDLPRVIIEQLGSAVEVPTAPMPHKHQTAAWLKQFLLTPRAQSLISDIYSPDYDFLETRCANPPTSRQATRAGFDAEDALKLPAFDREVHLRRTRTLSRSLATILESSVWRRRFDTQEQKEMQ